jgi:hypothetical protein
LCGHSEAPDSLEHIHACSVVLELLRAFGVDMDDPPRTLLFGLIPFSRLPRSVLWGSVWLDRFMTILEPVPTAPCMPLRLAALNSSIAFILGYKLRSFVI